jgi:homospermidine synthase
MKTAGFPLYGNISGPVLIVGYGSIGQAVLPIIKRHFTYEKLVIIDPL